MKVYLVGGAVRDQLLGLPVRERDWVVVGATPEELLKQGFKQVGRDFPVFLHPKTKEEYALARMERKSASGYYGFDCHFSPAVTLEEDLARRDLTINAMAMDDKGNIIDPYQGQSDLEKRVLRPLSPAFIEDPVRLVRLARFVARFHYLGFQLAEGTHSLLYSIVCSGELDHLVPERVWKEWQRSLEEQNPEHFILTLRACGALRIVLPEINALFGVPNPYEYHHEVDSGVHSLMVLNQASVLTQDPITRFAALTHDLGKALTPIREWPSHRGHEEQGVFVIEALCKRLRVPNEYRILAILAARYHLKINRLFEMRASTVVKLLEQTDAFRRPQLFYRLLTVCQADAQGCGINVDYKYRGFWIKLLEECSKVDTKTLVNQGYKGIGIKEALHQRRVACAEQLLTLWKLNEKQSQFNLDRFRNDWS